MYLKELVFLCLFFCLNPLKAQYYKRSQLDSLKIALINQEGPERINSYLKLADAYSYFQLDTAQIFIELARNKSNEIEYGWGICQSYFIETKVLFRQGETHVEEVRFKKAQCAKWFREHHFIKDALIVEMSRNNEVLCNEGSAEALRNAGLILKEVENWNDHLIKAKAWEQINNSKKSFFSQADYPNSADSVLYHFKKTNDSLRLMNFYCNDLFQKSAGNVSENEMIKLEVIARRWNNPSLWGIIMKIKCYPFAVRGNIDSTLYYVNKINELDAQLGTIPVYWPSIELMAIACQQAGDRHEMVKYLFEIIAINEKYGNNLKLAQNYFSLAESYYILKEYDLAIANYLKSMDLHEELEDYYMLTSIKRRLADLYVLTAEDEKAEELYFEVIEWAKEKQEFYVVQIMLGNAYMSLAKLYQNQKKYNKAEFNYQLSIDNLQGNVNRLIEPKTGLMSMYLDKHENEKADSMHHQIISWETQNMGAEKTEFYFQEGRLFIALEKYAKGLGSLNTYLDMDDSNVISEKKKEAYFLLYNTHKSLLQNTQALAAFEAYKTIEDSLNAGKVTGNVQKIQSDYELSLKESEIDRLEQQQEISDLQLVQQENKLALRKLYIILLAFAFIVLGGIAYLFFKRFQSKKEKEMEIARLMSLQKAELGEVKNNLYANISHEFKTPLTLIRVPLQTLRSNATVEDQKTLDAVIKNSDYMLEMLDELLGISKMQTYKVKLHQSSFNIASFLAQIKLNFARFFSEKNIQFVWSVELDHDQFIGDENRLNIVMSNLLKNAYSNTKENGWVKCEVKLKQELSILVSNEGKPIAEIDLPYIFDRFYRANDSDYSGTGIGLAWSKQIVELHGGTIAVDNTNKQNVAFSVIIPTSNQLKNDTTAINHNAITALKINEHTIDPTLHNANDKLPHILVVEDNVDMRELLAEVLKTDFKLSFAENGIIGEALANQLQPDLVLSDIMMPKKDGYELLKSLKENFNSSHIPVILLTARGDVDSRISGLNKNADDYIAKPFDPNVLKARINNLLRQRLHLHKLFSENPLLYSKEINCTAIDADFIDRVRKTMENNYANGDFAVSQLCLELSLNRTSVNTKIKALTNQSTAAYIKNFRLEKAVKMLIETQANMTEIYVDNGFNSPQSFNKAFKHKFACTPSEYRTVFFNRPSKTFVK